MIGDEIYEKLKSKYELRLEDYIAPKLHDRSLFEFIVAVMLSQNTSDKNAWKAYNNLLNKLGSLTPENILKLNSRELAELIKTAGMHYQRSMRIRELAEVFLTSNPEQVLMEYIKRKDYENARQYLIDLPGVGYKTADVVLLMKYNIPTFPVDTHIMRITHRLGVVSKINYDSVRKFWMVNTSIELYLPLHLMLITHGRKTCKAKAPICSDCTIRGYCSMYLSGLK
mgnify:CR=1 FL=1